MRRNIAVVCPHCTAIGRLGARPVQVLRCATCHGPLFNGIPPFLDEARFHLHREHDGVPLVVEFWAAWCAPSLSGALHFEAAARALEPQARLARVNIDDSPALACELGVARIPLYVLFLQGKEVARHAGSMPAQQLVDWVRNEGKG